MKIKISNANTPTWKDVTVKSRIPEEMQKKLQVSHVFLLIEMFHRSVLLWQDKLHRK